MGDEDRLDKVTERVIKQMYREGYDKLWTNQLTREIKKRTPVDTGRLKGSVTPSFTQDGEILTFTAETGITYAWYVEDGTEKMSARRMFELGSNAAEMIIDEDLVRMYEFETAGTLERVFRKIMSKL